MRPTPVFPFAAMCLLALPVQALADVQMTFRDGAPKDSFVISALGACDHGGLVLTLDMGPSAGGLIFDTTGAGAGVEVFQPFELTRGGALVSALPEVVDGQKTLSLTLVGLPVDQVVSFTIDVDDTAGAREITVTGSEIAGSVLSVERGGAVSSAVFDEGGVAVVAVSGCVG